MSVAIATLRREATTIKFTRFEHPGGLLDQRVREPLTVVKSPPKLYWHSVLDTAKAVSQMVDRKLAMIAAKPKKVAPAPASAGTDY